MARTPRRTSTSLRGYMACECGQEVKEIIRVVFPRSAKLKNSQVCLECIAKTQEKHPEARTLQEIFVAYHRDHSDPLVLARARIKELEALVAAMQGDPVYKK